MFEIVVGGILIIVGAVVIFNLIRQTIRDRRAAEVSAVPQEPEDETKTNESEQ